MFLANPYGLLALLGIPAVLLIHFFQRTARELPVSTLFLLEHVYRQSPAGRRFQRISNSIPLWLQLLAVLLLTWLLAEPRFPRAGSVQRVAIVLDSSASMSAFRAATLAKLKETLPTLRKHAITLELTALPATPESPRLYAGSSTDDLIATLEREWHPNSSRLDPFPALRLARTLVSREGTVLYLTDTPPETPPPFDAKVLSLGHTIENTGITGITFEHDGATLVWKAIVKNYGSQPARRTWQIVTAAGASTPREIEIPPGGLATLQSAFPLAAENVRLVLSPDEFTLDDVLPLVAPKPKTLTVFSAAPPRLEPLLERITRSLNAITSTTDAATADLQFAVYNPLDPSLPSGNAVIFTEDDTRAGAWLKGGIFATNHPLVSRINWQTLLVREAVSLDPTPADLILVRQESRPLVYLRTPAPGIRQLVFNFDPTLSNLDQQPAFIVLVHRFVESIRAGKSAAFADNFETHQPVKLTLAPTPPPKITAADATGNTIPNPPISNSQLSLPTPGFLTVSQGEQKLLDAAFHFGDPRESDFSACAPVTLDPAITTASLENNTIPDPWRNLWLLLLIATVLLSWHFLQRRRERAEPIPAAF